ncbi:MAG: type IV secretory system conjugative DNA transfer family protein [Bacteroidetes bacterium]|nr:type IV secretory system conjugative DNA transfer family protein [Bacteroidota bacterium]
METNLDKPLIKFSGEDTCLTIRDSHTSCFITGGVGSGKTSGSCSHLISKMMENGYGMLFLTVKADEAELYRKLAKKTGREQNVIEVSPDQTNYFNFIQYFSNASDGFSYASNIYNILKTAIKTSEMQSAGQEHDAFFSQSTDRLLLSVIDLCMISDGDLSIERIYEIAQSLPKQADDEVENEKEAPGQNQTAAQATTSNNSTDANKEEPPKAKETAFTQALAIAKGRVKLKIDEWQKLQNVAALRTLTEAQLRRKMAKEIPDYRKLKLLQQFFLDTMFRISSKTRSIIQMCIVNFLSSFLDDPMYSLFCKHPSTFTPDDCINKGSIIILNLPVMLYSKAGQDAQTLVKLCFQKAWQRRDVNKNGRSLALVSDECQYFVCDTDALFQTSARSQRISVVYITQNLSNLYANMGGGINTPHHVASLLGTFGVRLFHCNSHMETNEMLSQMAGQAYMEDISRSISYSKDANISNSVSYKLEPLVRPEEMLSLKCGGKPNDFITEAYVFIQGKQFSGDRNFKKVKFKQFIL